MNTDQLITKGKECLAQNDYVGAISALREAAEREPGYADVRHLLGLALGLAGQPEAALEEFDRALSLNPAYVEAHLNRAITLNDLGRYDEAREAFRLAWDCDHSAGRPFSRSVSARLANMHMELGDLYADLGSYPQAIDQYRSAAQLRADFLDIRTKLARALMESGDLNAARRELDGVLAENSDYVEARVNLGLVFYRAGQHEKAAAEWRACLQRNPDHPKARAFLNMPRSPAAGEESGG
ncbi:MAG: tetratricopeptide repeat protein [Gemmatimonadetes bacterium]|uniref:Tetratricopeptide repeat protein n=1 Tax=Candidatus Kutchimonas denitrificans TaxID=3056748 RepID=A0AAE5CCA0_9BACT|nr:tetratricopeptide repeat protein [Gemmatimonadota bacterium]NIR73889.1 tetratricopeptide repeat protein [Candidatus Kutchimonas denitrificans]NIR99695.1 tetratricopeptide repeat protein [Gemmatimonadota bacterium]NIT65280.1 tetratricopeptide repeat protein [Gemmatimonadota bacterium]NIW73729.1 tetratricopeptide repeat protein [Gemmatimonadota bacterium]